MSGRQDAGASPCRFGVRPGFVQFSAIRSQVDGGPVQVFRVGQSWSEKPGPRHDLSENASATKPAKLLAIFIVDTQGKEPTTSEQP